MAQVILLVLAGTVLFWAVVFVVVVVYAHTRSDAAEPPPVRMVECFGCYQPLPIDEAVILSAVPDDDDEREMGMGGTAMVAEYHQECLPAESRIS